MSRKKIEVTEEVIEEIKVGDAEADDPSYQIDPGTVIITVKFNDSVAVASSHLAVLRGACTILTTCVTPSADFVVLNMQHWLGSFLLRATQI